jgi:SAM-dependent methyltransferase
MTFMNLRLPVRDNTATTAVADPLKFHYVPLARDFCRARFVDAVKLLAGRAESLFEIGTGSGSFLPELSRWCDKLYACDIHDNLELVRQILRKEGIAATVERSSPAKIPFDDASMDAVVSMSVLEHIRDLAPFVDEIHRVLKPGGRAVIGVPVDNPVTKAMFRVSCLLLLPRQARRRARLQPRRRDLRVSTALRRRAGLAHPASRAPDRPDAHHHALPKAPVIVLGPSPS